MIRYVKIACRSCESMTCDKKPLGSYALPNTGCMKQVSNLDGDKFFHYVVEVKPMIKGKRASKELVDEMYEFITYIHDLPAGEKWRGKNADFS